MLFFSLHYFVFLFFLFLFWFLMIFWFSREPIQEKNVICGIHSVFIVKENILFLEEWIDHHWLLGFQYFFLYDNSKVQTKNYFNRNNPKLIPKKQNKHGISYDKMFNHLSQEEQEELLNKICNKYQGHIFIYEWSKKDKDGKIGHFQDEALDHILSALQKKEIFPNVHWLACIDMDEYIYIHPSKDGMISISSFLHSLHWSYSNVLLSQIKYESRFHHLDSFVVDIPYRQKSRGWFQDQKYICRIKNSHKLWIHKWFGWGQQYIAPIQKIGYCHYNLPKLQQKEKKNTILFPEIWRNQVKKMHSSSSTHWRLSYIS